MCGCVGCRFLAFARMLTPLPYAYAPLSYSRTGEQWQLVCRRAGSNGAAPLFPGNFSPGPASGPLLAGSLDAWLLERYCAFAPGRRGRLRRMVAQHPPWLMQRVEAQVQANTLGAPWRLDLSRQPDAAHFSPGMQALLWPFETWAP
jgi:uncharacterized protein